MKENILVLTGVLVLILTIVWIAGVQRPEPPSPPPLPDRGEVVAAPGATRTPAPDEDASNDGSPPTVTPIPFKEVIDKDKDAPLREKSEIVVLKSNGDYIKILITSEQLREGAEEDLPSKLGLSPDDKIVYIIPPASLMDREVPRPPVLNASSEPRPSDIFNGT